jgi:hypothetical protein
MRRAGGTSTCAGGEHLYSPHLPHLDRGDPMISLYARMHGNGCLGVLLVVGFTLGIIIGFVVETIVRW